MVRTSGALVLGKEGARSSGLLEPSVNTQALPKARRASLKNWGNKKLLTLRSLWHISQRPLSLSLSLSSLFAFVTQFSRQIIEPILMRSWRCNRQRCSPLSRFSFIFATFPIFTPSPVIRSNSKANLNRVKGLRAQQWRPWYNSANETQLYIITTTKINDMNNRRIKMGMERRREKKKEIGDDENGKQKT